MLTWTDLTNTAVRLSRDTSSGTLTQLQQDMNQGYQLFNAKLSRYFSRKQQFTDIIENQGIYQTPIDCVRIIGMTVAISNTYQTPVKEIRSEFEWRQIVAYPYASNWPAYYFMIGNDELQLWPTPSQDVTNGLRFYYQQQDHFLSVDDIVSSDLSPVQTCTVTNGSVTVTSTGSTFTSQLVGLYFQVTGVTDNTWYEIVEVPTSSTLTLKSAFVGTSGASQSFRIGQIPIIPGEYHDALVNYALYLFFSGKGNETRGQQHLGLFNASVDDAIQQYSSSTEGNVISDDGAFLNSWFITPLPPTS
jgi:hypothetical protein